MRSLWNVITPNVRKVSVNQIGSVISIYFYYDKQPSDNEIELSDEAATELIADFPDPFLIDCERHIVNFPEKIEFQGYLIYSRFET